MNEVKVATDQTGNERRNRISQDRRFNLFDVEMKTIKECLDYCQGNKSTVASMLGIDRRTLQRKLM